MRSLTGGPIRLRRGVNKHFVSWATALTLGDFLSHRVELTIVFDRYLPFYRERN